MFEWSSAAVQVLSSVEPADWPEIVAAPSATSIAALIPKAAARDMFSPPKSPFSHIGVTIEATSRIVKSFGSCFSGTLNGCSGEGTSPVFFPTWIPERTPGQSSDGPVLQTAGQYA